jgi:hypothetical protein
MAINESMTKWNKTEEFYLQVSRGQIRNHHIVHIFGYNPDVDSGAEETIWTAGGLYVHLDTPAIMTVSSTSANDTSNGTGARTVYILGINSTGGEVSETVTLNGQTPVNTIHTYTEIQTATVVSVGSGGENAGNIFIGTGTVTNGVTANTFGHILAGENKSLIGHYTVPNGYTGYLISGNMSVGATTASKNVIGRLKVRENDIIYTGAIVSFGSGVVPFDFKYPLKINQNACISATALTTTNDERISCYFQLLLIKNEGESI